MNVFLRVSAVTIALAALSHAEKIEPRQVPSLLDELLLMESEVGKVNTLRNSTAMQNFVAAAASDKAALEFYLKCYKELNFTRDDAKEADWRDWRDRNERRLKDKAFALALQLQLRYLVLTLQVQNAEDIGELIPSISRYLESLSDSLEPLEGQIQVLRESVTDTVFAKVYLLDRTLDLGDWAKSPMDLSAIFGKTIIPFLVKNRPEQIAAAWDSRIRFEQKLIALRESPADEQKFTVETYPVLLWQKAHDQLEGGLETIAVADMMAIAKKHTNHPSAPEWLREIRNILETAVVRAASEPAPEAAPETPPAPGVPETAPAVPQVVPFSREN